MAEIKKLLSGNREKSGKIFEKTGKTDFEGALKAIILDKPLIPYFYMKKRKKVSK